MKKVTVFLTVFLMASVAAATVTFEIGVNGNPWDGGDIKPSDIIFFIFLDDTLPYGELVGLTVNFSSGDYCDLSFRWLVPPPPFLDYEIQPLPGGGFNVAVYGLIFEGTPPGAIWGFEFHVPKEASDLIVIDPISGWWGDRQAVPGDGDGMPVTVLHLVPEPMTMALLGLGGLLALRRRK